MNSTQARDNKIQALKDEIKEYEDESIYGNSEEIQARLNEILQIASRLQSLVHLSVDLHSENFGYANLVEKIWIECPKTLLSILAICICKFENLSIYIGMIF